MGAAGHAPDAVANRDTPRDGPQVSLRTFVYAGKSIDRGQVFKLLGMLNDKRMGDMRYFVSLEPKATLYECPKCGEKFVAMGLRDSHVKRRHIKSAFTPPPAPPREPGESIDMYRNRLDEWSKQVGAMADAQDDREDKIENEVAPLDLTKTAASREG
jgi:hypothetical protein